MARRARIDEHMAREIFQVRVLFPAEKTWSPTSQSVLLARKYGITPKAVRDIWNRRTWKHATQIMFRESEPSIQRAKESEDLQEPDKFQNAQRSEKPENVERSDECMGPGESDQSIGSHSNNSVHVDESRSSKPTGLRHGRGPADQSTSYDPQGWMVCPQIIDLFLSDVPAADKD
ncbi:hypothetical protein GUITHDRAFT_115899 [Guillardia theta CCMP2712]|uniref:Uncharacterized protein n=2 Tax=Guillardia theta TaxID=55529 RepID=L1INT8_GUITC|nr:hypothetical protein GUITHDRAFT_115899 [Guillardia theta CCMP2712]EKX37923.1 hypothetical protein GUITHDRAFT_115899 [Guillardia theta CCMP2712]|mmetsp:Transcript_51623/g.160759  ORF Transcript_51623/g.160759 Transcript_51623/m.160759 type:complete len:175 (+) Transcript_51623:67-591(+)|eukprot:XP_005824903.1 hypothetical protein GUITHDRAFT_115899 [Guillardia theta CCMP2712]